MSTETSKINTVIDGAARYYTSGTGNLSKVPSNFLTNGVIAGVINYVLTEAPSATTQFTIVSSGATSAIAFSLAMLLIAPSMMLMLPKGLGTADHKEHTKSDLLGKGLALALPLIGSIACANYVAQDLNSSHAAKPLLSIVGL